MGERSTGPRGFEALAIREPIGRHSVSGVTLEAGVLAGGGASVGSEGRRGGSIPSWFSVDWLAKAVQGAGVALWHWDLASGKVRFTPASRPLVDSDVEVCDDDIANFYLHLHPDDEPQVRRAIEDHLERQVPYDIEYRLAVASGEYRWVQARGRASRDAQGRAVEMFGSIQDVTERRRAVCQVHESSRFLHALLDSLPAQIAVLDESGTILAVNRSWCEFGRAHSPPGAVPIAEGADYLAVCDRAAADGIADGAALARGIREVLQGRLASFSRQYSLASNDGPRWFECRVSRFVGEGPNRVVVAHHDVTDHRRAEVSVRELNERLQTRLDRGAAVRRVDVAIASGLDLNATLDLILSEVRTLLRADAASVLRLDPSGDWLETARSLGFRSAALAGSRLPAARCLPGQAVREARPVGVVDLRASPDEFLRLAEALEEGFLAYRAVPLQSKGGPLGVLEVFLRSEPPGDPEWAEFLDTFANQAAIAIQNARLQDDTRRSTQELAQACEATIESWSRALELRDKETQGHSQRVTEMTLRLARELGVREDQLVHIRRGALLHDIGKMGVPDRILLKPGHLSAEEWAIMQMHPTYAFQMLWPIEFLRPALEIPYAHHERWDGSGYPRGLRGEEIPLPARIFAVVDIWDALSHDRPYRASWSHERIREHIRGLAGTQLDHQVVEAFLRCWPEGNLDSEPDPIDKPADPAVPEALNDLTVALSTPNHSGHGLDAPTVLIVEDSATVREMLRLVLEDAGFPVLVASDGEKAWQLAQRPEISLVITDWTMPGLDGLELCRRIRRLDDHAYTYIILLTIRAENCDRLEGLRAGADDFLPKPVDRHELIARVEIARRILAMQSTVLERSAQAERRAAELRQQNDLLAELAWTDGLTGLCNRRRFHDALEAALSLAARGGMPLSVAMLDVDHFKQYNDAHGHQAGDEILRQLADILRLNVRTHDIVARHGGEEFSILLPETDASAAHALAERLRAAIDDHPWPHRPVTASLGVATVESVLNREPDLLLEQADRALYHSKRTGRNRVSHHHEIAACRSLTR
jgi:diguanylate cyclase (GGDEF)-like protein